MRSEGRSPYARNREGSRMRAALRRAFDDADSQADVPVGSRIMALGVSEGEEAAFIERLFDSAIMRGAMESGLAMSLRHLTEDVEGAPEGYDDAVKRLWETLAREDQEDIDREAQYDLFKTLVVLGAHEGFVLGVLYAINRSQAVAQAFKNRPRR